MYKYYLLLKPLFKENFLHFLLNNLINKYNISSIKVGKILKFF